MTLSVVYLGFLDIYSPLFAVKAAAYKNDMSVLFLTRVMTLCRELG